MQKTKRESGRNNKSRKVITTHKGYPCYKEQKIKRHIWTVQLSGRLKLTIFSEMRSVFLHEPIRIWHVSLVQFIAKFCIFRRVRKIAKSYY